MRFTSFFSVIFVMICWTAAAKEMTFDIIYINQTNIIVADGEITLDTPSRFQEFLKSDKLDGFRFIVSLHSPGGSLWGAVEFGHMIREHNFITSVKSYAPRRAGEEFWSPQARPGECYSACAMAFMGGHTRILDAQSKIGFHQFSSSEPTNDPRLMQADTQIMSALLLQYLVDMGGSVELFRAMSTTRPFEMFVPSQNEAREMRVITAHGFSDFELEPYKGGVIAYATFPENIQSLETVYQVTTYCRGGAPYVLFSGAPGGRVISSNFMIVADEVTNGFFIENPDLGPSRSYPNANIQFRANSQAMVELRIDKIGAAMLQSARGRIVIKTPTVSGYFFNAPLEHYPSIPVHILSL